MLSRQEANEDKQCQVMFTEQIKKKFSFLYGLFTMDSRVKPFRYGLACFEFRVSDH